MKKFLFILLQLLPVWVSAEEKEVKKFHFYWGGGDFVGGAGVAVGYQFRKIEFGIGKSIGLSLISGYVRSFITPSIYVNACMAGGIELVAPAIGSGYEWRFGSKHNFGFDAGLALVYVDEFDEKKTEWKVWPYPQLLLKAMF
jgi:hypothetical protein